MIKPPTASKRSQIVRLLFFAVVVAATVTVSNAYDHDPNADALVDWIKSLGGFVDSRQEIRLEDPIQNPNLLRGVFASENIPEGTVLLDLPAEAVIRAESDEEKEQCDVIWTLKKELELGENSTYAPYLTMIENEHVTLPEFFSQDGQDLLTRILGPYMAYDFGLGRHMDWFASVCDGDIENDNYGIKAMMLVVTRSFVNQDDGGSTLAPFYDMYNHAHDDNTHTSNTGTEFKVTASRDIQQGEQIFHSYGTQTPYLLANYGFIEHQPQQWIFHVPDVRGGRELVEFSTHENINNDKDIEDGDAFVGIVASFGEDVQQVEDIPNVHFLKYYELNRLWEIEQEVNERSQQIDPFEGHICEDYFYVLLAAIEAAVIAAEQLEQPTDNGWEDEM